MVEFEEIIQNLPVKRPKKTAKRARIISLVVKIGAQDV